MLELGDEAARRGLTIGAPRAWTLAGAIDREAVREAVWTEGYFTSAPSIPPALVARCRDAIELVRAAGAPPLASFAFDGAWELAAVLGEHASAAFGGAARLMPSFWAWRLDAAEARGWAPHRDHTDAELGDDGRPQAVSLWIPLTDATADNGCMYVVPAPWDPQYPNPRATTEVMFLQAIRALPAAAGSVLGWTSRLLHWGAMARPGSPPRISISFEFQDAAARPIDGEPFELGWIPPPAARRALIDQQWERYRHIHGGDAERRAALDAVIDRLLPP
ncbi:MAG TPA: phytanoyl-CoA dioxygenase family protein [Kofleriaceae bacterium]|nr:phytanoyl-CoA dioxygenase family protein [Kofleriaceae bacterium]